MKLAENKKENRNSKKKLILVLLLFAVIGIAGYGVYSYYFTEGNFSGYSDYVSIVAFDPQTEIEGNSDFLGDGGKVKLYCPDTTTGRGSVTCTGSLEVSNNGGTAINIEVLDANSSYYSSGLDVTTGAPQFSWTTRSLNPGESATLSVEVPTSISTSFGSDSPVQTSSSFDTQENPMYSYVNVSFKLKASQVHD